MCEWLTCREWCDVQLLCGGRTFSAHKAVLASVSAFLRQIFLSCPLEETPTFIVLPDFDLDAMSSVLYYIYNGEVVIQKQKLEMFLDIVKAMEIFIDSQYLPASCDTVENTELYSNTFSKIEKGKCRKVFTLGAKDQCYINVKKGEQLQDILQKCTYNDSDLQDKHIKCQSQDRSEHQMPSLGNLQSPYGDRQRNSFLRDLFVETYPRNGNSNGRTAGVLAISNELYRAPTSVLLTNANGKHPRVDDTLVEMSKETGDHASCLLTYKPQTPQPCYKTSPRSNSDAAHELQLNTPFNLKLFFENGNNSLSDPRILKANHLPSQSTPIFQMPFLNHGIEESITNPIKALKHKNQYLMTSQNSVIKNVESIQYKPDCGVTRQSASGSLTKNAIFNQVTESPWCPRLPYNYRPFRRKNLNTFDSESETTKEKNTNDSNNNIQKSILPPNPAATTNEKKVFGVKEPLNNPYSIANLVGDSEFKCSVCNQMFSSNESLTTHMRRHSSSGRYTCGECSKSFSQLRNFKYHMSVHRGTREFAATCTVCGKYFNDRGYLSSHMKIHRNRKEYKCSQCPKSFNQRVAYNMHVRIHTGVKPHVCGECGKAFSRKMLLKQHQRTHSGERPYACPHCEKRFADRSNMTLHLRLHTGVKPFSCSLCPKSFTKKHHLKSHLNFHTGAKPYSCPRCKLAFTQSSNMRTHLKKCTAPAPSDDYTGVDS